MANTFSLMLMAITILPSKSDGLATIQVNVAPCFQSMGLQPA
jgi:hypothetical protein